MTKLGHIQKQILLDGLLDWVGLWMIVRHATGGGGSEGPAEDVKALALHAVEDLLAAGCIAIGSPTRDGHFVAWNLTVAESISRMQLEWQALGRAPDIGEICWVANTDAGDQIAKELIKEDS